MSLIYHYFLLFLLLRTIRCLKMYKISYKTSFHNNVKRILRFKLLHSFYLPLEQRLFGFIRWLFYLLSCTKTEYYRPTNV